ncbi:hypothetical protein BCR34DRAFT_672583 [Clohesyomyces aquaticus]|uniref:Cora-like Mg2+ transporter protein-domain-containing protein n=1 Tax=Clohesyomyces aquaticus TaxID=1231657 RepID=A0A1Y1ZVN2_9PLEO|nr:hypothetical protein BCR34DRAFT_672583 [Clohesyomyces aquaticus]
MALPRAPWNHWPNIPPVDPSFIPAQFEVSHHPELQDMGLLDWGKKGHGLVEVPSLRATVDVLRCGLDLNWDVNVSDERLLRIVSTTQQNNTSNSSSAPLDRIQAFFIDTRRSKKGWLPGNFSIHDDTLASLRKAGLSSVILASIYNKEGFWAKMGNHSSLSHDAEGNLSAFEYSYMYQCGWGPPSEYRMSFTQVIRTRCLRTYFCINYPPMAMTRLKAFLAKDTTLIFRPLFIEALAAGECLKAWQNNMSESRKQLREHEQRITDRDSDFSSATTDLHLLSREWHTFGQDCRDFRAQLEFLQHTYKNFLTGIHSHRKEWMAEKPSNINESLECLKSQCDGLCRWTTVYRDRTNVHINLLFHLRNLSETQNSTQIAASTATVAEQTRRDSASMITLAAITMLFLPGTFVSAILSTTVFDYGNGDLNASGKWWVLPAVTIPLTLIVFGLWLGWLYKRLGNDSFFGSRPKS